MAYEKSGFLAAAEKIMSALYTHAVVALRDRQISYGISFAAGIRIGIAGVLKTGDEPQLMKRKERRHELRIARIEQYYIFGVFVKRVLLADLEIQLVTVYELLIQRDDRDTGLLEHADDIIRKRCLFKLARSAKAPKAPSDR